MSMIISGDNGVTFPDNSIQTGAIGRNRIINGAMVIDQRNAGASVTISISNPTYSLDRWGGGATQNSKFTIQQNAGSVTPPAGFTKYLGVTSSSAYSITSTDYFYITQRIEGFNWADLGFGTANAQTVTISFWVRSSLTGTFGGALVNENYDRGYPFTYTISSANTWEKKTITIAGDTTGTWNTTNTIGAVLFLSLGSGSLNSGTAGAWAASGYISATGATSVVGTNGATFYITGVQLEKGSAASPFEYRSYGQELALCQRYFETNFFNVAVPTNNYGNYCTVSVGSNTYAGGTGASQQILGEFNLKVSKRAAPTVTIYSYTSSTTTAVSQGWTGSDFGANSGKINVVSPTGFSIYNNTGSNISTGGYSVLFNYTASAEL